MKTDTTLGERLRIARKRLGLTQEEAGQRGGGFERRTVMAWERDDRLPQLEYVRWLCDEARVNANWLLYERGHMDAREREVGREIHRKKTVLNWLRGQVERFEREVGGKPTSISDDGDVE